MMIKRTRSWKHKVKPCNDLDGASRRDKAEKKLGTPEKKDEATRTENVIWWTTPERRN